jgi:hypothetical protein
MKRSALFLASLVLVTGTATAGPLHSTSSTGGKDDSLFVTENGDGKPTVQLFDPSGKDITATNITILASGSEFIHFTYTSTDSAYIGQSSADMLETDGSTLSDRVLVTANGTSTLDIQFQSDPNITLAVIFPFPSQVETGKPQNMYPGLPDTFNFNSSPVEQVVPEPATLTLFGIGSVGLVGYAWRRRKPAAGS